MGYIIDFFKEIGSFITMIIDFVVWLIESLLETLALAVQALGTVVFYVSQFPVYWLAPFVAIITIAIIYKVRG